ncbi:hypothetical protein C8R43DRAFT_1017185 [Mycena crocata]|nr:hypothetical protein C8R43DRAFT_1017185 [Mycena crocata]
MTSGNNDPKLPLELEREIFEFAAILHPKLIPVLLLAAERVRIWTEPLLYRALDVSSGSRCTGPSLTPDEIPAFLDSRPASFFLEHVRHLHFGDHSIDDWYRLQELASMCCGVVDVALLSPDNELSLPPVQRVTLYAPTTIGLPTLYPRLTHLHLQGSPLLWNVAENVAQLPCLTHLSFPQQNLLRVVCNEVLVRCKRLKVLANIWDSSDVLNRYRPYYQICSSDTCFVMLIVPDLERAWDISARGGEDYWLRAEALVKNVVEGKV